MSITWCRFIRWKTGTRPSDDPVEFEASMRRNQVPFRCLKTCQTWGPDDDLVAPELCRNGRRCFESTGGSSRGPTVS